MNILVLDDSFPRLHIFKLKITECLGIWDASYTKTAKAAIAALSSTPDFDYIFLDHDLGTEDGGVCTQLEWDEDNNGMQVVDWIIANNYRKNVSIIIHSWNIPRSIEMKNRLTDAGYSAIQFPGAWHSIG